MKRYEKEEVMTHQCQDTNQGWVLLDVSCQMQRKTYRTNKALQVVLVKYEFNYFSHNLLSNPCVQCI